MKTAIALFLTLIGSVPQTATYTSPDLNLAFNHPKSWTTIRKGKDATMTIPVAGGAPATLDIKSAVFYSSAEQWEGAEAQLAKTLRHEIVRQWREDLLGVPWLLIKTQWKEGEVSKTRLSGLMYGATVRKMVYHLTADTDSFDRAEEEVRGALSSLHTIDGTLPQPEDPEREKNPTEIAAALKSPPVVIRGHKPPAIVKAPVMIPTKAAGLDVILHLPSGWTAEKVDAETYALKCQGLAGSINIKVLSTLDSAPAERALIKASSESGKLFKTISDREDRQIAATKSGTRAWYTWRTGTGETGPLILSEAAAANGDFYWLMNAKWSSDVDFKKDARLIQILIDEMSVELPS